MSGEQVSGNYREAADSDDWAHPGGSPLAGMAGAIDRLAGEDLDGLADPALAEELVELHRQLARLQAQVARRVARAHHRGLAGYDGAVSTAAWLRWRCRLTGGEAQALVRAAVELEEMPATAAAFGSGDIGLGRVRMLAAARHDAGADHAEAFGACEDSFVDVARHGRPADLRRVLDRWRAHTDGDDGAAAARAQHERRALYVSRTFDGMVALRGDLDAEAGETVILALEALTDHPANGSDDRRTPAQRRADALTELCRVVLDQGLAGGTERPHLSVVIDWQMLAGTATTGRCDLEHVGSVNAATARRLACDAAISRIITGPESVPLDLGRSARTVPPALRRALIARDGGCRFPGCDRPPGWCQAHHGAHWADGGPTSLDNTVLLCGRHHRAVHEGGYILKLDNGVVRVLRPDGSEIPPDP